MGLSELGGKFLMEDLICNLREFAENDARSCSLDFGCAFLEFEVY